MMHDTQSWARLAALIAVTASFATLWANDRPESYASLKRIPQTQHIARNQTIEKRSQTRPQAKSAAHLSAKTRNSIPARETAQQGPVSLIKQFSLISDELMISQEQLAQHLQQLPMGLKAGNYRIVDPYGGVGWLIVTAGWEEPTAHDQRALLTTTVDQQEVRFLRVQPQQVARREDERTR